MLGRYDLSLTNEPLLSSIAQEHMHTGRFLFETQNPTQCCICKLCKVF
ncbi:hypothetical protein M3J09_009397 [Ascochyta lentis]